MNSLNLSQLGGLPLTQADILWLQNAFSNIFSGLSNFIGDKVIVSGMQEAGGTVTNGIITLNGEFLPFIGGTIGAGNFAIVENTINRTFRDGNSKPVRISRFATFSIGGTYQYADLTRPVVAKETWQPGDVKQVTCDAAYIAANFDVTGKGINKRTGWAICNGQNGTADLRGKFLAGYDVTDVDYSLVGKAGGEKKHTLTVSEMPSHKHTLTRQRSGNGGGGSDWAWTDVGGTSDTKDTGFTGGGAAFENRPPFYTILFIQKL